MRDVARDFAACAEVAGSAIGRYQAHAGQRIDKTNDANTLNNPAKFFSLVISHPPCASEKVYLRHTSIFVATDTERD